MACTARDQLTISGTDLAEGLLNTLAELLQCDSAAVEAFLAGLWQDCGVQRMYQARLSGSDLFDSRLDSLRWLPPLFAVLPSTAALLRHN